MKKIITRCLFLSLITGCMTPAEKEQKLAESKQELIENPGSICKITVNKNYREVYKIVQAGMIEAGMKTEELKAELHTNTKEAEISACGGATTVAHYKIKALSPTTSELTEYYFYKWKYKHNYESYCAKLKKFIEEYED